MKHYYPTLSIVIGLFLLSLIGCREKGTPFSFTTPEGEEVSLIIPPGFEDQRTACLSGYTPDLTGCHVCGSPVPERFDLSAGMLECRNCRSSESSGIRMPVPPSVLEAMRYICHCDSKKLFSFQAGEDTLQQLSEVTEAYLATQLERGFSTLDFYKSLLI